VSLSLDLEKVRKLLTGKSGSRAGRDGRSPILKDTVERLAAGFTLVELMIVIAIIAAIAIPSFLSELASAKTTEAGTSLRNMASLYRGAIAYYQNNSVQASSLEDLAVDDALRNGEKGGYDWVYFPNSTNAEHFAIEGYPANPYAGHLNFYMSQNGIIRYSDDGRADETSPILQQITLDPDFQNPPPMGVPDCWYGPYTPSDPPRVPMPTTLEAQADADAALFGAPRLRGHAFRLFRLRGRPGRRALARHATRGRGPHHSRCPRRRSR
jgi:prepilin-type N-terminal cleavage/methylation domain-containing protein